MMLSGAPPQDAAKQDGDQAVIRVLDVPGRAESEASAAACPIKPLFITLAEPPVDSQPFLLRYISG